MVSDKTLTLQICRKRIPTKMKSSETSQVFTRREKSIVCVDRHTGRQREPRPRGSLNHCYGAFLPAFLWPVILLCLVLSSYLVYLRILPCVHASLGQDGFQRRGLWVALASLSVWPPRSFLGLLDFENKKYVASYLLSG